MGWGQHSGLSGRGGGGQVDLGIQMDNRSRRVRRRLILGGGVRRRKRGFKWTVRVKKRFRINEDKGYGKGIPTGYC